MASPNQNWAAQRSAAELNIGNPAPAPTQHSSSEATRSAPAGSSASSAFSTEALTIDA